MKILVVTQYFWPEQFKINDLCSELVTRGHDVTVYTGLPNYPEGRFFNGYSYLGPYSETMGKVKIIRCPLIPRGQSKGIQLALNYFSFCFLASLLAPFLVRGKFDKVFVYEPSPITVAIPGIVLKYLKGIPMFLWVTDLWPESLEATGAVKNKKVLKLISYMVKWIYHHTDKILVTSRGFIPSILQLDTPSSKIKYWPQWAESFFGENSLTQSTYEDENIPKSGFKIMFAGNIGSSQDFATILKAAELLKEHKEIHFLIVGDGMMKKWVEKEIEKLNLKNTFHLLGKKKLELMPYYYSKADVMLVSLSNSDLFTITVPAKLQSYLASGKPILASLNGEGAQIVRDSESGLTSTPENHHEMAQRVLEMSKMSSEVLQKYGQNAFKCYQSDFERNKLIGDLEHEFHNSGPQ